MQNQGIRRSRETINNNISKLQGPKTTKSQIWREKLRYRSI